MYQEKGKINTKRGRERPVLKKNRHQDSIDETATIKGKTAQ